MFKISLLATVALVSLFAQAPKDRNQSKSLDVKNLIQESIDKIEKNQNIEAGGWLIDDRKRSETGESFIIRFAKSKESNLTIDETYEKYKDLVGLSIYNDINYTEESFISASTLTSFPDDNSIDKNTKLFLEKIINDKVIELNSNYNIDTHRYHTSFKDIDINHPDAVNIVINGFQMNGFYDQNNLTKQQSKFSIDLINIIPLKADNIGEYIKINNIQAISKTEANGENININYAISIDLFDVNIDKEHSKVEKVNLAITIGNLNLKAYENLIKYSQENVENLEDSEELQILTMELFARSKKIYIEVSDLSLSSLMTEGKNIGPVKMSARVSLKGTEELIQKIATAPEAAMTALNAELRFQFPKEILQEVYKENRSVGSIATLFAKYENESVVYDITFKDGILIINDQFFPLEGLENINTSGETPQIEPIPSNHYEVKKEIDSIDPEKQTTAKQNRHIEKYEQNSLHQAVLSKSVVEVKRTLENAPDINSTDKLERTPLHYAAFNGDLEIARLLIEKGADVNAVDRSKQWTPLFFAVFMKHDDMANLLIKEGADQTMRDKLGRTADEYRDKK
ncbi:MAG: DUF945 family protein [Campylobacterota bacterium]|nr:DUF945 family protein [Campylobacterota bacterium]